MPELVGPAEVATICGVSRQRLAELRARPDFPAPAQHLAMGPIWYRTDIERYQQGRLHVES